MSNPLNEIDVAEVVRGLTKAQRDFILHGRSEGRGWVAVFDALDRKGLMDLHPALNARGIRVRNYIKDSDNGQR